MVLTIYAASHFLVDLSCALLVLGRLAVRPEGWTVILLYNFFAFAGQMPLGLLADRLDRDRWAAGLGCALGALAWVLPRTLPAAVCAGVGNALFHVGGGRDTLGRNGDKAGPLGVFVAPGALGIFLGALWGARAEVLALPMAVLLLLGAGVILRKCGAAARREPELLELPGQAAPALACLFLVVILRSWTGFLFDFPWRGQWSAALVGATVLGKVAGGLLADRFGLRRTAGVTLALAAGAFLFSGWPAGGLGAVFLFNMTMPLTLYGAARKLPGARGFAFGLLTFALFLGFLPTYLGWEWIEPGPAAYAGAALASLGLLLPGLGKEDGPC